MSILDSIEKIYAIEDEVIKNNPIGKTYLFEIRSASGNLLLRGYTTAHSRQEAEKRVPFGEVSLYRDYPIYNDQMVHYDI